MLSDAPITFFMLILNALVGAYTLLVDRSLIGKWAFKPYRVKRNKEWGRWLTAGFAHVGLAHLAFNMITLFFFGPEIEMRMGWWRFLIVYLGAELAANAVTYWRYRDDASYSAVGASGAVSGIAFAFCLFRPLQPIYFFFIPIGIPAVIFAFLYVAISIYAASGDQRRGGIAHEAHVGGAIGGLLLTLALYPAALTIFLSRLGLA